MKKLFFVMSIALTSVVLSCDKSSTPVYDEPNQDNNLTENEVLALSYYYSGTHVSQEEATLTAQSIMDLLDSSKPTKSSVGRSISSVKPITKKEVVKTKAGDAEEIDTVAYVFNFSDDEGYTILSADRRTNSLLALVPEGNIDFEGDFNEDILKTGLMVFYGNLEAAYNQQIKEAQDLQDSLISSALAKLNANNSIGTKAQLLPVRPIEDDPIGGGSSNQVTIEYGTPFYESYIPAMIPVRWGQDNPYNLNTPVVNGLHCATGCGATAVAQLMAYWRYPSSYNWSVMMPSSGNESLSTFQEISRLMYNVGVGINTRYQSASKSSSYFYDIPAYLSSIGYNAGNYAAYNENSVRASLQNHRPVLIAASAIKHEIYHKFLIFWEKYDYTYYDEGHAWILDGIIRVKTPIYVVTNGIRKLDGYKTSTLVHCNFGWPELTVDGYYNWGVFNTNNGPVTRASTIDHVYGTSGYYQYEVECITNIYK